MRLPGMPVSDVTWGHVLEKATLLSYLLNTYLEDSQSAQKEELQVIPFIHKGKDLIPKQVQWSMQRPHLWPRGCSLTVLIFSVLLCFPPKVPSFLWCCFMKSCLSFHTNHQTLSTKILTIPNTNQPPWTCSQKNQTMARLPVVKVSLATNKDVQISNFCGPNHVKTYKTAKCNRLMNTVYPDFPVLQSTKISIIFPFTDKTRKGFIHKVPDSSKLPALSSSSTDLSRLLYHICLLISNHWAELLEFSQRERGAILWAKGSTPG